MESFWTYLQLGFEHICDWQGYDHILFVAALCGMYLLKDWKRVLILVTAFTVGHSITLALSIFEIVKIPTRLIEFLIPVTILITALSNIYTKKVKTRTGYFKYFLAAFFGLIHGMGFSNYLKSLLGHKENIVTELLAFNLGLELGQALIVTVVLVLSYIVVQFFRTSRREWNLFLSSAIFGIAFVMAIERYSIFVQ